MVELRNSIDSHGWEMYWLCTEGYLAYPYPEKPGGVITFNYGLSLKKGYSILRGVLDLVDLGG